MSSSSADLPSSDRSSSDEALIGTKVGKYEIVRVIGRGGMGSVYEALNTSIGKRVAMKFVDAEAAKNRDAVARFQREAQAASAVESAHIVEIFDSGIGENGLPYIVMELLRGEDLGHRIKRLGRLELAEACHIIAQLLRGLHRAHEAGIVHRDLKPDNIFLVDRDDEASFAKILDFGISKVQRTSEVPAHTLTRQGTVLGTPFYMSPEQAQALPDVDGRTDIWSVGAILYECLSGRPPHSGNTYEQVIINICMKDAEDVRAHNPGVPAAVAGVLKKTLARDRADRFQTARELLDALSQAAPGLIRGRNPEDTSLSSNPSIPARTPIHATPSGSPSTEFGPTVEVPSGMGASRVGWSTSGRSMSPKTRTLYVGVATACLFIGGLAAFLMFRDRPHDQGGTASGAQAAAPVEMRLRSNVSGARFSVDGAPLEGGVLRGNKGERRKVRVEADGYAPVERDVQIDPASADLEIALDTARPVVTPGASASAEASASAAAKARPAPVNGKAGPLAKPVAGAGKTGEAPAPTPPPAPTPKQTGVASGLQLKTE